MEPDKDKVFGRKVYLIYGVVWKEVDNWGNEEIKIRDTKLPQGVLCKKPSTRLQNFKPSKHSLPITKVISF